MFFSIIYERNVSTTNSDRETYRPIERRRTANTRTPTSRAVRTLDAVWSIRRLERIDFIRRRVSTVSPIDVFSGRLTLRIK